MYVQTEAIITKAIADPDSFVLKPQREGGGNNVWGTELVRTLKSASVAERGAYVLMQRIKVCVPQCHFKSVIEI